MWKNLAIIGLVVVLMGASGRRPKVTTVTTTGLTIVDAQRRTRLYIGTPEILRGRRVSDRDKEPLVAFVGVDGKPSLVMTISEFEAKLR